MDSDDHYLKKELYTMVRTSPELFDFLQQGSLDGIWYWDVEKPENEWMSPEFKALFGYEDHEVPNTSNWWQTRIDQDQLPEVLVRFQAHIDDPDIPYDQVVRYTHRDGSSVWVRCRGIAIRDEKGRAQRILGCHTDVTPLKRAELKLGAQIEKLTQANRELEHFSQVVSHDLQEPLRKIRIFGDRIRRKHEGALPKDVFSDLDRITDTASRMSELITSMLTYTRFSHKEISFEQTDLGALISEVLDDLEIQLEETGAQVHVHKLPDVRTSEIHMHHLFLNLISNGLKFHKTGRSPQLEISCTHQDEEKVVLEVTDQGVGFDSDRYGQKVFKPFERLGSKKGVAGTGIGLSVCQKVVDLHQGDISVSSKPGGPTRFTVTLLRDPTPS